jgi:L-fuculose-phosphate aldolase
MTARPGTFQAPHSVLPREVKCLAACRKLIDFVNPVIGVRDIRKMIRSGQDINIPGSARITPAARNLLNELQRSGGHKFTVASRSSTPADEKCSAPAGNLSSKSPRAELEAFFNSACALQLKQQICEIGRRLWQRAYVDGNGGNMAIRVGEDMAVCTPTLVSKGWLKPEDMCLVDFEGNQLCGVKKRTSEILLHLQIMQRQPNAMATCHCHPPCATGFALAGIVPATCMIPEYEVFVSASLAPYRTPGTPELGKLVAELVDKYNTILMANHGIVTWSHNNIEEAYWLAEILETYCRTLSVTAQLGKAPNTFTPSQLKDLLKIKQSLGYVDPRFGMKQYGLGHNAEGLPAPPARSKRNLKSLSARTRKSRRR